MILGKVEADEMISPLRLLLIRVVCAVKSKEYLPS